MPNPPLTGIKACVFDAYGTLFDFASAAPAGAGLAGQFDAVLSVEEVGTFKPDPRVYRLAVDRFGVPAAAIAFVRREHGGRAVREDRGF